jgi:hypothetical protein
MGGFDVDQLAEKPVVFRIRNLGPVFDIVQLVMVTNGYPQLIEAPEGF